MSQTSPNLTNLTRLAPFIGKTVKIKKEFFEDGYLDIGMLAVVNDIRIGQHGDPEIVLDLSKFHNHNVALERANYWDKNTMKACLTASQYGAYPKNHIDRYYIESDADLSKYLEVIEDPLDTPAMMLETLKMVYTYYKCVGKTNIEQENELMRRLDGYWRK